MNTYFVSFVDEGRVDMPGRFQKAVRSFDKDAKFCFLHGIAVMVRTVMTHDQILCIKDVENVSDETLRIELK